ncbi:peptidase M48 [Corticibacter populi]|uniref:Peptidase M48 n=1 Tax=Corticibacter populi TaxID=1550736 RepID=A0A3M6QJA3_9BURK|nr:M48 family metallopeptidase [Corticibacter populi]RMX03055.1 peptidase M48 [Corticibacter populi]RZS33494.1 peptidase M48-like protein [Corticibacter populi]
MVHAQQATTTPGRALRALWFDGLSSAGQPVLLMMEPHAAGPQLLVQALAPGAEGLRLAHAQVQWPQTYGKGDMQQRLTVDLGAHGSLEVQNACQWHAAYAQAGGRPRMAERLQTRWRVLLGFTALALLAVFVFLRYGTPAAATQLARLVPIGWETRLTDETLTRLDVHVLAPSRLEPSRQQQLRARFEALRQAVPPQLKRYGSYQPVWRMEFRRGLGANALAFPGGLMILTDEMVELAQHEGLGDEALMGVLAHEMGHVLHRHSSRQLIEQGVLGGMLSLAMGDVSGWVALAGTGLTSLAYGRRHEREADCFALALLRHQRLSPLPLARLLGRMTQVDAETAQSRSASALDWLSTHPDAGGRVAGFQRGESLQCDMATGRLR